MVNLQKVCRLCCSSAGLNYNLFIPNESGASLAEDLNPYVDFEITKDDQLSELICDNCYEVHSFFREFRKNCTQINDYFKKQKNTENSISEEITIKKEKEDDYEDQSVDPLGNLGENSSGNCEAPYPVALVHASQRTDHFGQLRSKFLAASRLRDDTSPSLTSESRQQVTDTPPRRAEKRKHNGADGSENRQRLRIDVRPDDDLFNHVVKQEEIDINDSPMENETYDDAENLEEPWSPAQSHHSINSGSVDSHPSTEGNSSSSSSSCSSDDSDADDDDDEMLLLLALLL